MGHLCFKACIFTLFSMTISRSRDESRHPYGVLMCQQICVNDVCERCVYLTPELTCTVLPRQNITQARPLKVVTGQQTRRCYTVSRRSDVLISNLPKPITSIPSVRCGVPQKMEGISFEYDNDVSGSLGLYSCGDDYRSCGSGNVTSLCQYNGAWGSVNLSCHRFKWGKTNLGRKMSATMSVMVPVFLCWKNEFNVNVAGIPTGLKQFEIGLLHGKDDVLKILCTRYGVDERFIILQRYDGEIVKQKVFVTPRGNIPSTFFGHYKFFALKIRHTKGEFIISVDGHHILDVKSKRPSIFPNGLYGKGTVTILSVEVIES